MKTTLVPALALTVVAAVAGGSFAVKAEPLQLTSSQMEAVTAGLVINVSPQISAGNVAFLQQLNVTTQTAQAFAVAIAACGICSGNIPAADAAAAAANANLTGQGILQ